jgi:hypothetical protein
VDSKLVIKSASTCTTETISKILLTRHDEGLLLGTIHAHARVCVLKVSFTWLALLLRIQEVMISNVVPDPDYSEIITWFISVPRGKLQEGALERATAVSFHILSNLLFTLIK